MEKVEFGVLGPVLVRSGDEEIAVRGGKQRTVLAVLLLNAGRVVSTERLIDALWGENPPPSADVAVRNYVMRLRRDLGAVKERLRTRPPGYLISADPGEFDVSRFEMLLESAREAGESGSWDLAAERASVALGLWRGDPLCDVESDSLVQRESPRLAELRLRAVETRIDADLRRGRPAEVIGELEHLIAVHPMQERLRARLMLALYQSGRQADALAAYQNAREELLEMLGVEPGEALRDLHQRILSGDRRLALSVSSASMAQTSAEPGTGTVVPRQLPRAAGGFVGRDRELSLLSGLLRRSDDQKPGSAVISVISGTAGVGKTALAVLWAHAVSDRFPDGQLYVNLRGYDPDQPVAPGDALAGFLRVLGLPVERIPASTDERAAAFRSTLAGKRVLIVLDNAREVEQVRPLLPGSSSCLVVVTSRNGMPGLVARDGAVRVNLDLLPEEESVRLLRELIGGRAAADSDSLARLAVCCCRLPLALRVAAELANARVGVPLAELTAELSDRQRRLDLLDTDGDVRSAVREVFSWSYRNLDAVGARIFRLAGLYPGPDFDAYAVAALADVGLPEARRSLDRLAQANLIQLAGPGRYGLHDLLRDYARELAAARDSEKHRHTALTRLFDYYLHTAEIATETLSLREMGQYRGGRPEEGTSVPAVTTAAGASAWLEAERASLVAVAVHAADNGWPDHAITLSAVLSLYLDRVFRPADSRAIHEAAHRAARASADRRGEISALNNLAGVDCRLGRFRAVDALYQALASSREISDRDGEARTLGNLGVMSIHLGRFEQAIEYLSHALTLCREAGDRQSEARVLNHLSRALDRCGCHREAIDRARESLILARELGNLDCEATALGRLGDACMGAGRFQEAASGFRRALRLFREVGGRHGEAEVLVCLAVTEAKIGRIEQAVTNVRRGLALCREVGEWLYTTWALTRAGDVLLIAGRSAEARDLFADALELSSRIVLPYEQARAHYGLGRVHVEFGHRPRSRFHLERALALFGEMGAPEADHIRACLAGEEEAWVG